MAVERTHVKLRMVMACDVAGALAKSTPVVQAAPPEPGFWAIGNPAGSTSSAVTGLTSDGSVACGGGKTSYTWMQSGGRNDYGLLPGMPVINYAMGLSNNGVTAGSLWSDGTAKTARAYRWTGRGPLQDLGLLPGETRSFAHGVSGDGSVVVGHAEHGQWGYYTGEAFRWTAATGMQGLGHLTPSSQLSDARAVSRDGKVVVGMNLNEILDSQAFVWTERDGMKALPQLVIFGDAGAEAVNADGSVTVGSAYIPSLGKSHAVRWTPGGVEDIITAPYLDYHSHAYGVGDDGRVVAGAMSKDFAIAFIWSEKAGLQKASDYLKERGVAVPSNYQLEYVYAISGDGLTFGGMALNKATGIREGFVAKVPTAGGPCQADCDGSSTLNIDDFICFQTYFALGDGLADCDGSQSLDIDDYICFQTFFALGC